MLAFEIGLLLMSLRIGNLLYDIFKQLSILFVCVPPCMIMCIGHTLYNTEKCPRYIKIGIFVYCPRSWKVKICSVIWKQKKTRTLKPLLKCLMFTASINSDKAILSHTNYLSIHYQIPLFIFYNTGLPTMNKTVKTTQL